MAELGQSIVKSYLESLGFEVKRIKESVIKTPDFEVYNNGELIFYCEEKTLDKDDFEGSKPAPTYNSISSHVHKATKQFRSVNAERKYPNVLAFVNFDEMNDAHDLFITLIGYALLEDGNGLKIRRVGRISNDLDQIDLYLWFQKDQFSNRIWAEIHKELDSKLKSIIE